MLNLTRHDILKDIENFQKRIDAAKAKLDMIPNGYLQYNEHRKREVSKQSYLDEISHCRRLIKYAEEALHKKGCECHGECRNSESSDTLNLQPVKEKGNNNENN